MLLPLRGGAQALSITYDLDELREAHSDANRVLEETWASLLTVLVERWPDWPIEVWARLSVGTEPVDPTDEPEPGTPVKERWELSYRVFFSGEGPESADVTAMADFILQGLAGLVRIKPELDWGGIDPDWHPLWAVDDAHVIRLLAPERGLGPAVYLIGHYAGQPALFAAAVEAWSLSTARVGVRMAEADTEWAF